MTSTNAPQRFGCYVGNIDRTVTLEMLKQVFSQCGTIIDCSLNGRDEDPYRYGFIDFASEDDRQRAMKYNGFTLVGRKLKVGHSKGNLNSKAEGTGGVNNNAARNSSSNTDNNTNNSSNVNSSTGRSANGSSEPNMASMSPFNFMGMAPNPLMMNPFMNSMGLMASGMPMPMSMPAPMPIMSPQQTEAQLLLQLIQQGSMDPRQLTPAQQQLLVNHLSSQGNANNTTSSSATNENTSSGTTTGGNSNVAGVLPGNATAQSTSNLANNASLNSSANIGVDPTSANSMLPQQMNWNTPMLGNSTMMGGVNTNPVALPPFSNMLPGLMPPTNMPLPPMNLMPRMNAPYHRTPVNPPPSEEMVKLREVQKRQYLDVVRKEAEKYEKKINEKKAKAARRTRSGSRNDGEDSETDDESGDDNENNDDDEDEDEKHINVKNGKEKEQSSAKANKRVRKDEDSHKKKTSKASKHERGQEKEDVVVADIASSQSDISDASDNDDVAKPERSEK